MLARLLILLLLTAGPALAQSGQPNPSFNLVNHTTKPIVELYATPAGRANWGLNRLTGGELKPGMKFAVRTVADGNCVFDIRAVFADKTAEERRAVNTCQVEDVVLTGGKTAAGKGADDPSFKLVNRGTQPIVELFATPAGQARGANLLAAAALAPGGSFQAVLPHGACSYDLRVVFADHTAKERKATDLCRVAELPVP